MSEAPYLERLRTGMSVSGGRLCVGLDPHPGLVSERFGESVDDVGRFLRFIIEQTIDQACVYKPNAAFYEALGPKGLQLLQEIVAELKQAGRCVIYDAKRGDIASTAAAYATAATEQIGADAITLVPYMGEDAVRPFLDRGLFVYLVALPSNDSAREVVLHGEPATCLRIASMGARLEQEYPAQVGLVVGATQAPWVRAIHEQAPDLPWLVPGVGAQGGDIDAFLDAASGHRMMVFNASRSILGHADPKAAAAELKNLIGGER